MAPGTRVAVENLHNQGPPSSSRINGWLGPQHCAPSRAQWLCLQWYHHQSDQYSISNLNLTEYCSCAVCALNHGANPSSCPMLPTSTMLIEVVINISITSLESVANPMWHHRITQSGFIRCDVPNGSGISIHAPHLRRYNATRHSCLYRVFESLCQPSRLSECWIFLVATTRRDWVNISIAFQWGSPSPMPWSSNMPSAELSVSSKVAKFEIDTTKLCGLLSHSLPCYPIICH